MAELLPNFYKVTHSEHINETDWVVQVMLNPVCFIDMLRVRDFIEIGKKFSHISLGFLLICPTVYLVATRDV